MNDTESYGQGSQIQDLRDEVSSLRTLLQVVLFSALVVTGSLCIYLFRQTGLQARQISSQKEAITQMTEEANKLGAAAAQFQAFGIRYPDFAAILAKYGLKPEPLPMVTNAPTAAPAK